MPDVFIIGAGLAGLACGRVLRAAGFSVRMADKGRGPGGRLSSRRTPAGRFDHGAVYMTARSPVFRAALERWAEAKVAAPWNPAGQGTSSLHDAESWFVGAPAMNAPIRFEAEIAEVEFGLEVGTPVRRGGRWHLSTSHGHPIGEADLVILAAPAPQTAERLPAGPLRAEALAARYAPCWTLLAAFDSGLERMGAGAITPKTGPLDMIALQSSRPGREPGGRLVVHAAPSWSEAHLEDSKDAVAEEMTALLRAHFPDLPAPRFVQAHRWRYARVTKPTGQRFGFDPALQLGTCGDWHIGARCEAAYLSGHELGEAVAAAFAQGALAPLEGS